MAEKRRVNLRAILAAPDLRRELMIPTLQATQAREGIDTTREQAERAYYVVTEGERTAFFDLQRFANRRGEKDRRESAFALALSEGEGQVRVDAARRDFGTIGGAPLAYREVTITAQIFRYNTSLEPAFGRARRGAYTGDDPRYVRQWWEVGVNASQNEFTWEPFAKGGEFSRFYSDVDLIVHWDPSRRTFAGFYGRKGREVERPESLGDFFKPGLTWPRRTQRGFNLRVLPVGCIFSDKGPTIFPVSEDYKFFLLGVGNSAPAEYLLRALISFGSWEVGAVKRLPVPGASKLDRELISSNAEAIYKAKATWDHGNEISTQFKAPWILQFDLLRIDLSIPQRLDKLLSCEAAEESRIQRLYAELNGKVYQLYNIPDTSRIAIEVVLDNRAPEILWPQMEGKSVEQKRMEHVFRLLSYAVKRVVEADEDGVLPFVSMAGEPSLLERVLDQIHSFFPDRDIGQVEIEIVNELNQSVKGYRRTRSLAEWLENVFFDYHTDLYKSRPIFWHIASSQRTSPFAFGALVHYHKFSRDRMAKLRSQYLREAIETFLREAALADKEGRADDRIDWQDRLEEAQDLDRRLQWIQEGHHEGPEGGERDFRILPPWKTPEERPLGWGPDLDDGVKVNIEPLQKAGVLRIPKVI